jgi:hypothetical protein
VGGTDDAGVDDAEGPDDERAVDAAELAAGDVIADDGDGEGGGTFVQPTTNATSTAATVSRRLGAATSGDICRALWTRSIDVCFFTVSGLGASSSAPTVFGSGT